MKYELTHVTTFENVRDQFRVSILKTLYKLHLENSTENGVHERKMAANELLKQDLAVIRFCPSHETSRLIKLIPLVRKSRKNVTMRKKDSDEMVCTIILMLYYGYVLSEQSDDFIPDMTTPLRELLGYKDGCEAYRQVVHIASSSCEHCSRLRRFFLFGEDL